MISIIIPHHADEVLLSHCLEVLYRHTPEECEIIVVLNNVDRREIEIPLDETRFKALRVQKNLGSAGAYMLGVQAASFEEIVFLDNDALVTENWLSPLLTLLRSRDDIAAVSAKMISPSTSRIVDYGIAFTPYNAPHPFFDRKPDFALATKDRKVQAACSAAMAVKKSAYTRVGGFTRIGTAYYNDIELCLKLNQAGYQVWVSGTSTVFHKSSFPGMRSAPYKASPLKADQKGRFMAEFGNLIREDMASYFDEAFAYFLADTQPGEGYYLVNMSSIIDADVHIDWVKAYISIDQILSYPTYVRDEIHCDVIGRLPPDLARTHIPLVYFVDRFTALQNNDYWFLTRPQSNDMIVDRNANVMWARDIALPGT